MKLIGDLPRTAHRSVTKGSRRILGHEVMTQRRDGGLNASVWNLGYCSAVILRKTPPLLVKMARSSISWLS